MHGVGYRFVPIEQDRLLYLGSCVVDLQRLEVRKGSAAGPLTPIEGRLLSRLARDPGTPVDADVLLSEIWGLHNRSRRPVLTRALYRLRQKLEEDPSAPRALRTIRGRGIVLEVDRSPTVPPPRPGHCSPPQVDVVGRDRLLDRLLELVEPEGSTTTLHGPAGIGKTTLARLLATRWPGPAVLVELHHAEASDDVARALGVALGVGSSDWERLGSSIRLDPGLLIVLDDAEKAIDGVRQALVRLAATCEPRVVVTSRRRVGVRGERVVAVPSLDDRSARQLLTDRAADRGVALDPDDPRLGELVAGLRRLPLAVELAAARLGVLGLDSALARLDRPLALLGKGATPRHATMAEVVHDSLELLAPEHRALLAALTAFPSDFTVPAAEAVCPDHDVLEGISALFDHGLLARSGDRLRLGFAVREVVAETDDGRAISADPSALRRALDWYADRWTPGHPLDRPDPESVVLLRPELSPALLAIREGIGRDESERAARCVRWVGWVLIYSGREAEVPELVDRLGDRAALDPDLDVDLQVLLVSALGTNTRVEACRVEVDRLAALEPSEPEIRGFLESSRLILAPDTPTRDAALARVEAALQGPVTGPARVGMLRARGRVRMRLGDVSGSRADLEAALAHAARHHCPWDTSVCCHFLAILLEHTGQLDEAEAALEHRWRVLHPAMEPFEDGHGMVVLSRIREGQGRLVEALDRIEGLLARANRQGQVSVVCHLTASSANILATLGRLEEALEAYRQALAGAHELRSQELVASVTANLGEVNAWMGDESAAIRLLSRARELYDRMGSPGLVALVGGLEARVRLRRGEVELARDLATRSVTTYEALGNGPGAPEVRMVHAELLALDGAPEAEATARDALQLARRTSKSADLVHGIAQWGRIAAHLGLDEDARAARDEAAALAERAGLGIRSGPVLELSRLRDRLDGA